MNARTQPGWLNGAPDDAFDPFGGSAVERVIASSQVQREVWLADRLGVEASLAFNESITLHFDGPVDARALRDALRALVARHACLRATVSPDGMQLLINADAEFGWHVDDLTSTALDAVEMDGHAPGAGEQARSSVDRALRAVAAAEVRAPFDLSHGPLLRARLCRLAAQRHALVLTAHHIVCDGWSWGVMVTDLGHLYAEKLGLGPTPEAADDYTAYLDWEQSQAHGSEGSAHEQYWLDRFAGTDLPVLALPTDRLRPPVRRFESQRLDHVLNASLVDGLRTLGAAQGTSLYAGLLAGFAALLGRLTGQDDLVIGVPAAGQAASGLPALVGHCVHLLPVRVAVAHSDAFNTLCSTTGRHLLDAFDHQALNFGGLLSKLPIPRDAGRLPLVSVMFNLDQATRIASGTYPSLEVQLETNPRCSENFELFINACPTPSGGLLLECQYSTALFDEATVSGWLRCYETLLSSAVRQPSMPIGALPWLSSPDAEVERSRQPALAVDKPASLMHSAFGRQVAFTPNRFALNDDRRRLTHAQLDARSNQLARWLRERGIGRGDRVGICVERGVGMVEAMLGVLKSGACYVPLDPGFPAARLAFCAADAALAWLLVGSTKQDAPRDWRADAAARITALDDDDIWSALPSSPLLPDERDATPDDPAYVIYTSGSTGQPKGVIVAHRGVANLVESMVREPGLRADDRLAAVTTLSFDIAVLEIFGPLSVGAEVDIVAREVSMDGLLLSERLISSGATLMQATPGLWRSLIDSGWRAPAGFRALVGGESLPAALARDLLATGAEVWNLYGPTETTIWSTAWRVDAAELSERGVSIGRPVAHTSVWVLDEQGQPCPQGVPGELFIGGRGVALGYLGRPELTAERFVPDTFSGHGLMFRTGDRGRWRSDGLLEHLGRLDSQVKLRGYRIELGEIETALAAHASVAEVVATIRDDAAGDARLIAYVVPAAGGLVDESALRTHLARRLPDYMLPQHIVALPAMPRLPNGKVDRRALPAPQISQVVKPHRATPSNDTQRRVLGVMEEVLKLPGIGIDDDFFALGGHSLLAARLSSRLQRDLGIHLPMRQVFEAPTVRRLAQVIDDAREADAPPDAPMPIAHDAARHSARLTPMQERIRFIDELYPDNTIYNTPSAHRLSGPFDLAAFRRAFAAFVQRQPALRSQLATNEQGQHELRLCTETLPELTFVDLTSVAEDSRQARLHAEMQSWVERPFKLTQAPLFHACLYRLQFDEHVLLFVPHHLVWDGWSFDVMYADLSALYALQTGQSASELPILPVTVFDHAQALDSWLQGTAAQRQIEHWRTRFENMVPPRSLPTDAARRPGMVGEGESCPIALDERLTKAMNASARGMDVTLSMLALTVYAAMLGKLSASREVVIGMPVRGRSSAELEHLVGFFNNLLPLPLKVVAESRFDDAARLLKAEVLAALSNQDVPFELLSTLPEITERSTAAGLYQASFSFQDMRERPTRWGNLEHSRIDVFHRSVTEEIGLWLGELPGGLTGAVSVNAAVYTPATAAALRDWFVELLAKVVEQPQITLAELCAHPPAVLGQLSHHPSPSSQQPALPDRMQVAASNDAVASFRDVTMTPMEHALAEVWAKLLGIQLSDIRSTDNFFDLGADSMMVLRAVEAGVGVLGVRVDARRYIYESLGQIAATPVSTAPAQERAPSDSTEERGGMLSRWMGVLGRRRSG